MKLLDLFERFHCYACATTEGGFNPPPRLVRNALLPLWATRYGALAPPSTVLYMRAVEHLVSLIRSGSAHSFLKLTKETEDE